MAQKGYFELRTKYIYLFMASQGFDSAAVMFYKVVICIFVFLVGPYSYGTVEVCI